jgi:hypothetical protein
MRNTSPEIQAQIRQEAFERLAGTHTRQEKTREIATLLFFKHGIYPSAALVRDYTGHGSITDINSDLRAFWADLREKTAVRIDAAMLPESVTGLFGEALGRVWDLAVANANESLNEERKEAAAMVARARQEAEESRRQRAFADERFQSLDIELRQEREKREVAEKRVDAQTAEIEALQSSLVKWQAQADAEAEARRQAEERFSHDLEAERAARQRDMEMLDGEVRFAKLQIDAARTTERDLRERLRIEKERTATELAAYRRRADIAEEAKGAALIELAELKGRIGEMHERLKSLANKRKVISRSFPSPRKSLRR